MSLQPRGWVGQQRTTYLGVQECKQRGWSKPSFSCDGGQRTGSRNSLWNPLPNNGSGWQCGGRGRLVERGSNSLAGWIGPRNKKNIQDRRDILVYTQSSWGAAANRLWNEGQRAIGVSPIMNKNPLESQLHPPVVAVEGLGYRQYLDELEKIIYEWNQF